MSTEPAAPDRYRIAVHEAGHAVIGRAVTLSCGGVTIVPDDSLGLDGSMGHAIVASVDDAYRAWESREKFRGVPSAVRGRIIAVLAGGEAEAEILGPPLLDAEGDREVAEALAEDLDVRTDDEPAALARLRRATRQLVRRHRADIETIAGMLIERGTLTGEEVDAALPPGFMARPVTWPPAFVDEARA